MLFQKAFAVQIAILSSLMLAGCSGAKEGSLLSDKINVTDCPTNSCATGVPDQAETKLVLTSPISNVLPRGSTLGEVTGDCYASLYPQNYFDLVLKTQAGQVLNVANHLPANFLARCENGKFYVPLNLMNLGAGLFTLEMQLVVIDSAGAQIRPAFKNITSSLIVQQ